MARRRSVILLALVLVAHLVLLDWVGQSLPTASVLKPVAKAVFTREVVQTAAPLASVTQKPKQKPSLPHIQSSVVATSFVATESPQGDKPADSVDAPAPPEASLPTQTSPTVALSNPEITQPPEPVTNDWPADTRLSYALTGYFRGPVKGDARVQWQKMQTGQKDEKEQGRYQVGIDIDLGIVSTRMTSQGVIGRESLEPKAYEEKTGPTLRSLLLEPARIRLMNGEWVPRPPQVQDTASQFVELAHRFSTQPALLTVGKAVPIWLARPGGVDEWTYDVIAQVELHSEHLGTVSAYHLKPRPLAKPRGPVNAEIWFAPSLQYLPVRIRLSIGADAWLDLMVEKIEQQ